MTNPIRSLAFTSRSITVLLAGVLATTSGCPSTAMTDASTRDVPTGTDIATGSDGSVRDVPASTDVPSALDAVSTTDVPPLADTGPIDAPPWDGGAAMIRATHPRIYLLDAQL